MDADEIPEDSVLEELGRNELRSIAAEHSIPADASVPAKELRRNLARKRDGGKVLECPRDDCGHGWVFVGQSKYRASCPDCGTSVRIEINRIDS